MEVILGIDLGTTNSEVAVVRDGIPVVLEEDGDPILPSVVGLDVDGRLLVGRAARNQYVLAPERTVRSVKRKMGQDVTISLGEQQFTPQEISAIILRTLKSRAETALGQPITKAVITVPAFFNDVQRDATREAGALAGLEVVRIINEPTAAVLTYDPHPEDAEVLMVYDLGGGTFDVSIARVEQGVVEILSSHGNTQLGGDDFDERLFEHVAQRFQEEHGVDPRASVRSRSRLLTAVEEAKKRLSHEPFVRIEEAFIAEKDGLPLNLSLEVSRDDYEDLIGPLVEETLECLERALADARLHANQIDKVLLVGGATRTPLVQSTLSRRLGRPVHLEIEPDLAVAMGAAVQGGLISGVEVGAVLVDITPHTLGLRTFDQDEDRDTRFSPIIPRNTVLPARRTEVFATHFDGQQAARLSVYQGEHSDIRQNSFVGEFNIEGLADVPAPNLILVQLDLNLSGILTVTATEKTTGLQKQVVIDSMMSRFRSRLRAGAVKRLDSLFRDLESTERQDVEKEMADALMSEFVDVGARGEAASEIGPSEIELRDPYWEDIKDRTQKLMSKAMEARMSVAPEDADELGTLTLDLEAALRARDHDQVERLAEELEDLLFYISDR